MNTITNEQAAYIAGIIDGEGCITIKKTKQKYHRIGFRFEVNLTVVNTDFRLLDWLKNIIGKGRVSEKPLNFSICSNPSRTWFWVTTSQQARIILERCLPYFVIKREQAELAIEFAKRQARYQWGTTLTAEAQAYQEWAYQQMRLLKKKDQREIRLDPRPDNVVMPLFILDRYPPEFQPKMAPGFPLSLSHMCKPLPPGYD
jgi:hypothetical protein